MKAKWITKTLIPFTKFLVCGELEKVKEKDVKKNVRLFL